MTWQPNKSDSAINQKYYRVEGDYTIAKVKINGEDRYELFKSGEYLGHAESFEQAVLIRDKNGRV
jgi:hypothetical protein